MIKKLSLIFIILISVIFSGCGGDPTISYANSSITIEVGQYCTIKESDINVNNMQGYELTYGIDNKNIATIKNATIKGVSIGKTTLHITATKLWTKITTTVEITVNPVTIKASSATFDHSSIILNMQSEYTFNNLTLTSSTSDKVNEVPVVNITPNIATYDYKTGKFVGLESGECTVTVSFVKCSASFTANIFNHIYVNTLIVNNLTNETLTIYKGESGKLNYTLTPNTANTYSFSTDSDIITLSSDGTYTTNKVGECLVTLTYKPNYKNEVSMNFTIKVIEKVSSLTLDIVSNPEMNTHGSLYQSEVDSNVAVLEKEYLLLITTNIPIDTTYLNLGSDITLTTDFSNSGNVYSATIKFNAIGTKNITINYLNTVYGVTNSVTSNNYTVTIYSLQNLVVEVRYNLLQIQPTNNVYTVYKKPYFIDTLQNAITYIDFVTYLDTNKKLPYVDNVTSSVTKNQITTPLTNNLFNSTDFDASSDNYTIDIFALGKKVHEIQVKVLSVDIQLNIDYDTHVNYADGYTKIDLSIANNFDTTTYEINSNDIALTFNDSYSEFISTSTNTVTFNNYIEQIEVSVYYKGEYVNTVTINLVQPII